MYHELEFHLVEWQPAWPEVFYVFKEGSSQCILVSKATRPTLEVKVKLVRLVQLVKLVKLVRWATLDIIKKTSIICPATWERGR